jgi:hypothetical protein
MPKKVIANNDKMIETISGQVQSESTQILRVLITSKIHAHF